MWKLNLMLNSADPLQNSILPSICPNKSLNLRHGDLETSIPVR